MTENREERLEALIRELKKLHEKLELSAKVGPDYFEPGMMEYLDQYEGTYDPETGKIVMRFEAKGTRYDGRTERIEMIHIGDPVTVLRDPENQYNPNNFTIVTGKNQNLGNVPKELCNAMADLYDAGDLIFESASVSFADPVTKRSRHAKQAVLFIELNARIAK